MEPHLNDVDRKPINIMALGRFNKLLGKGDAFDFRDSLGGLFLFSMTRLSRQARDLLSTFASP
jgi:hypothetical protein